MMTADKPPTLTDEMFSDIVHAHRPNDRHLCIRCECLFPCDAHRLLAALRSDREELEIAREQIALGVDLSAKIEAELEGIQQQATDNEVLWTRALSETKKLEAKLSREREKRQQAERDRDEAREEAADHLKVIDELWRDTEQAEQRAEALEKRLRELEADDDR
jgi:DNA repair exonuclease SbcCD ATPase subunit